MDQIYEFTLKLFYCCLLCLTSKYFYVQCLYHGFIIVLYICIKVRLHLPKTFDFICLNKDPKNDEKMHLLYFKSSFCPAVFGHVGKHLDNKAEVNFKLYGIKNLETNNYNTFIAHIIRQ